MKAPALPDGGSLRGLTRPVGKIDIFCLAPLGPTLPRGVLPCGSASRPGRTPGAGIAKHRQMSSMRNSPKSFHFFLANGELLG